ncbi:TRAP transporter substrate-binding protein [Mesorhizobium sp. Z1-4]|uniref:TRAP transporter substrate-binding protein n=1 Tax=Mesorhizobium sp. Z1-4 TaxID=2448478 RepID=UPI000FD896A0|nr:TRAP transporter substrate-binding protein [Mesorhizobium sp. Z1-4]
MALKMLVRIGAIAALTWAGGLAAAAEPVTLRVIGPANNGTSWKMFYRPFFEETLPAMSEGKINVELTSLTDMGIKGPEVFRLVRLGVTDIATTVAGYTSGEVAELDGYDLTGAVQDIDTLQNVVDAYTPAITKIMDERVGVTVLGLYPSVPQGLWCAAPISGLEDIKGKKVRVFSATQADLITAIGGTPVTLAFAEVVPALQRKVIECAVTGTLSGNISKWPEVTTHLYPINMGWSLYLVVANTTNWNALSEENRNFILDKLHSEMIADAWQLARDGDQQGIWCSTGDSRCTYGEAEFVTPYDLELVPVTDEDKAQIRELVRTVQLPKFAERCGTECVQEWNATVGEVLGIQASAE